MDGISSLGLAANIVQTVDFAQKLLSFSRITYAESERKDRDVYITYLASALTLMSEQITSIPRNTSGAHPDQFRQLIEIAEGCRQLVERLQKILSLAGNKRHRSPLDIIKTTHRRFTKIDELKAIEDRMTTLQATLNVLLVRIIGAVESTNELSTELSRLLAAIDDPLTILIVENLTDWRFIRHDEVLSQAAAVERLFMRSSVENDRSGSDFKAEPQIVLMIHRSILEWLGFSAMQQRLEQIRDTHAQTFRWIYDSELQKEGYANFPQWLQAENSGVYWVKGREGAGKSTLLKYIWQSSKTREYLQEWHKNSGLCTAAFSLWRAGSSLARSTAGLLRSLLHSLLSQRPELISLAFPFQFSVLYRAIADGFDHDQKFDTAATSELIVAFKRLVGSRTSSFKIFLLVDGLDECDGDLEPIISLFQEISSSSNIKLVFSSREREYDRFKDAFGTSPSLVLENMNRDDIEEFVQGSLMREESFRVLEQSNSTDARSFVQELTDNSNGLFLWAQLAVGSIVRSLRQDYTITDLRNRLTETPTELFVLYERLLAAIPAQHKKHTARLFSLLREWNQLQARYLYDFGRFKDMPLLDMCFALGDVEEFLSSKHLRMSEEEKVRSCHAMGQTIKVQCADFITVANPKTENKMQYSTSSRIGFSHRTVLDFFSTSQPAKSFLETAETDGFNAPLSLLKAVLHRLKILDTGGRPSRRGIWDLSVAALVYANHLESSERSDNCNEKYVRLLDDFDTTMQQHHTNSLKEGDQWASKTYLLGSMTKKDGGWQARHHAQAHWSNFHPSINQPLAWRNSMQSVAVEYGLIYYLAKTFEKPGRLLKEKRGRPLLDYALRPLENLNYTLISQNMVTLLLERGAKLGQTFEAKTCWEQALDWQYQHKKVMEDQASSEEDENLKNMRLDIFKLLLSRGAETDSRLLPRTEGVATNEDALMKFFQACFGPLEEPVQTELKSLISTAQTSNRLLRYLHV